MKRAQLVKISVRAGRWALLVVAIWICASAVAPSFAAAIGGAAALFVILFEVGRSRALLAERLDELQGDIGQTESLIALGQRLLPRRPLPPMVGFAIAPDFALLLTTLIADEKPELVVETGSGVSTLVTAYALEKLGRGRVIALEHDAGYAAKTRAQIELHGLSAYAAVVHAPLEPLVVNGEKHVWHALAALDGIRNIDLVIDDGPPRYLGKMLRYASLPIFMERMSARGIFVLDVVGDEERVILGQWAERFPAFIQEHLVTKKGNVILRRRG